MNLTLRIIFASLLGLLGLLIGREISLAIHWTVAPGSPGYDARFIGLPVLMTLLGISASPFVARWFERLVSAIEDSIARRNPSEALFGTIGLVVGLIVAFLVRDIFNPFVQLPHYGQVISFVMYVIITLFFAYAGVRIGLRQRVSWWSRGSGSGSLGIAAPTKLLDTSVIVDGRVLEIVQAGFLDGTLLVPKFVLKELQLIADSADPVKRSRGRRGLEVLNKLRDTCKRLEISDADAPERDVDGKLVTLARTIGALILTNDYNLNRVARVQGVGVLNINELANALKPVVLPGEEMSVSIVKDGKEQNQGVAYLDDGTMIVVENGRRLVGEEADVLVTSVLQTAAGRMIFAKLKR
ncbi:MAG: TRAM domain-containing protein [Candidatus Eremiobacteraeota bacterium]|nr:TRAM domain-containing protein [Candidatus Eremiobacteraeota bacterium]